LSNNADACQFDFCTPIWKLIRCRHSVSNANFGQETGSRYTITLCCVDIAMRQISRQ